MQIISWLAELLMSNMSYFLASSFFFPPGNPYCMMCAKYPEEVATDTGNPTHISAGIKKCY